ncbi:MAG: hypothetical protein HXX11_14915 [Desulfuromonadales bacterium]|nr:hypothetical protein [Desulfuromonadales bacterium]
MTIETLFGSEQVSARPRTIRIRRVRAVYETMTIKVEVSQYSQSTNRRNYRKYG